VALLGGKTNVRNGGQVRRIVDVLASAVLALALSCAPAAAAGLSFGQPRADLASQLMLSLFGETSDSTAAFSAQNGDRASESPLREMALRVPASGSNAPFTADTGPPALMQAHIALSNLSGTGASYLARAVDAGLLSTDQGFAASPESHGLHADILNAQQALYTAAYQPVAPAPIVSPGPGTLAFNTTPAPTVADASSDTSLGLGSDGRAPKRSLSLTLSGQYEHVTFNDFGGLAPPSGASSWQLPDANTALTAPDYAGSNRLSLGAGLAVPVFHGLTLNLNYDAEHLYGGYTLPGLMNIDAVNNKYAGGLTYDIPYSSSSLSISAYQSRLGDSLLPAANGYTQNGGDLNFTVKF
jgi:hypothetical protein